MGQMGKSGDGFGGADEQGETKSGGKGDSSPRGSGSTLGKFSTVGSGWEEWEDELTGESYYYHPETGETSWDTPAGASYAGGSGGAGGGRGFANMQRPPTHTRGTRKGCSCPSYIPLLLGPDSTCNCWRSPPH